MDPKIGCKMVKNALNKLIFRQNMYFYGFHQFLKGFWKMLKIGRFLAEKRSFSVFSGRFFLMADISKFIKLEITLTPVVQIS